MQLRNDAGTAAAAGYGEQTGAFLRCALRLRHGVASSSPIPKVQAGLSLYDCRAEPFLSIPVSDPPLSGFCLDPAAGHQSLLFIPNRDPWQQWGRWPTRPWIGHDFAKAALSQVGKALDMQDQSAGGSTLATQVGSIVILPDGLTVSPTGDPPDGLCQCSCLSAGARDPGAPKLVAWAYLSSVPPLSAAPGYGEVHGSVMASGSGLAPMSMR